MLIAAFFLIFLICIVSSDVEGPDKLQVEIPSGSTSVSVIINIVNDNIYEGNENFTLTLNSKGGAQLGSPNEALISIVDDDCELFNSNSIRA